MVIQHFIETCMIPPIAHFSCCTTFCCVWDTCNQVSCCSGIYRDDFLYHREHEGHTNMDEICISVAVYNKENVMSENMGWNVHFLYWHRYTRQRTLGECQNFPQNVTLTCGRPHNYWDSLNTGNTLLFSPSFKLLTPFMTSEPGIEFNQFHYHGHRNSCPMASHDLSLQLWPLIQKCLFPYCHSIFQQCNKTRPIPQSKFHNTKLNNVRNKLQKLHKNPIWAEKGCTFLVNAL